jgi:hypothetical protein
MYVNYWTKRQPGNKLVSGSRLTKKLFTSLLSRCGMSFKIEHLCKIDFRFQMNLGYELQIMGKVGSFDGKDQSHAGVHFRGQKIPNLVRRFVFKFCKHFTKSHKR